MPLYLYKNPKTKKIKEIVQRMTEPHVYFEDGLQWERVFLVPQASFDTKFDPLNPKEFVDKTKNKKGNVGNLWDEAREASLKREKIVGKDPLKEEYYKTYKKKRKGKEHQDIKQQKLKKELSKSGIDIEF
jgi:hypothetical protein